VTHSSKVVSLTRVDKSGSPRSYALPPILNSIRQRAKKLLAGLAETVFNHADDSLFEMADRSRNDADQHLYFDSMREIRLHRRQIANAFLNSVYQGFGEIVSATPEVPPVEEEEDFETAVGNFSLVKNDQLEVSVAVSGIVSKVTSQFSLQIMQLTKRMDSLYPAHDITEQLNPLGPHALADAFVCACESLDVDIRVRIILLKLFERYLMEQLGPCYDDANQMLAESGVLPNLRHVLKKSPEPTSTPTPPSGSNDAAAMREAADTGFAMLQSLLSQHRAGGPGAPEGSGSAGTARGPTGPLVTRPQLMDALSGLQTDDGASPIDLNSAPQVLDLRELVIHRTDNHNLGQGDEDTVNLVGMLFDYILNDRNLAIPMKALIARLQIPILKVAVLDKGFFGKTSHPARQLLNELSSAGIGWSGSADLKRDSLYNKIESVVLRVLNHFDDDLGLFETLVIELRGFVSQDDRRTEIVEQRVKETETGKAKTIAAKQTVEQLINQKASGMRLPQEVGRFISDVWSRFLVYVCLKNGTQSEPWAEGLETFDQLLWSVQPLDRLADVDARDRRTPELLTRIEQGMRLVNISDVDVEKVLGELSDALAEIAAYDRSFLEDDDVEPVEPDLPLMEEIVLTAPGDVREKESTFEPDPQILEQLESLNEGVWVELTQDSGERLRCKLAAIVEPGDKYVFVNRRGMKVAERTRTGLAVALKAEHLTVLDESQVFDRALEAVIGNLRQLHRGSR
jgi:hypothetical protein